jgi:hypothetical protein
VPAAGSSGNNGHAVRSAVADILLLEANVSYLQDEKFTVANIGISIVEDFDVDILEARRR